MSTPEPYGPPSVPDYGYQEPAPQYPAPTPYAAAPLTDDQRKYRSRLVYAWVSFGAITFFGYLPFQYFASTAAGVILALVAGSGTSFVGGFWFAIPVVLLIMGGWTFHLITAIRHKKTWTWGWIAYSINIGIQVLGAIATILILFMQLRGA